MFYKKICILALTMLLTAGCAARHEPPAVIHEWELTPQAGLTFYYLRAQDEIAEGRFLQAASLLGKAIEANPDSSLYIEMARSYWRGQERAMAIKSMQEAVKAFPHDSRLYFFWAELLLADNQEAEAVEALEKYRDAVPDDLSVYQDMASFYIETGDSPKALDLLEQVPDDKKTASMFYYMGRASNELGDRRKAITYLRRAVDKSPGFLQAWAELAFIYEQQRDYLQAEEIYEKLLNYGERNPELILRIIELNLKLNDPDRALMFLSQGPIDVQFRLDAAHQFISNSFYNHAYEILSEIRHRGAYPPTVYFYLALIAYEGWSDPEKALACLQSVPTEDYYHMQALSFSIQIFFEQEQYEDALDFCRDGRELYPAESRFVLFESIILEVLHEYPYALEVIRAGLEQWPEDTDLIFRKGAIWDKKGDKEKALEAMENIISLDQDHHEALNYAGYTLAEQNRDLDRALVLIKRALQLDPANGYYIDSLAWVYYMQGEYEKAWQEIRRAVEFVDDEPVIWEHYGDIAKALGMYEQALYGYEKALKYEPDNLDQILEKMESLGNDYEQP